jgi:hypothetical protein
VRAVMGVGGAVIFPATLAIISNLYTERGERARAIGLCGAMTGLGVYSGRFLRSADGGSGESGLMGMMSRARVRRASPC